MSSLLTRSLKYFQVPGTPPPGYRQTELHDRAYRFWLDFWTQVLKKNRTDKAPNPDDFLRQTVVGFLESQGEIVALHAHSFFDTGCVGTRAHSYFSRYFSDDYLKSLHAQGANTLLSMELYSVLKAWRSPKIGVSLASVMIGLGVKLAQEWNVDAAVGIARVDVGVDRLVQEQGAVVVGDVRRIYNTPCKQIAFFPQAMRPHPSADVSHLVEAFWNQRTDTTRIVVEPGLKQAA